MITPSEALGLSQKLYLLRRLILQRVPAVADYVKNRTFEAGLLNKYLSYMHDNQASGEEAALEFILNEEATWSNWVSKDAVSRIKKAL